MKLQPFQQKVSTIKLKGILRSMRIILNKFAFLRGVANPVASRRIDGEGRQFILYQAVQ